jgi:two-component system sensor histidine kinase BaeS
MSKAALASLNEEVLRLNALVDDLHLLAMVDLDGPICHFTATDANELCRNAVDRFRDTAATKGLEVSLSGVDQALPVTWDPARIDQLLANILTNSLRYTDPPGEIRVALEPHGDWIRILVDDSAPCPLAEHLPHLFEPLYRVDEHRSRISGGSGLGLSICEAIVRCHSGSIAASPSPLGGLRMTIDLPGVARAA